MGVVVCDTRLILVTDLLFVYSKKYGIKREVKGF